MPSQIGQGMTVPEPAGAGAKIALEEHTLLARPDHIERWRSLVPMLPTATQDELIPRLADTGERRLEEMDKGGVDLAVLSNVGSVQGDADPAAALRLAREANDQLAEVVRARPDRFAAFATTPLQDPAAGADELERAVTQLGLRGTMLFGATGGRYLDDPGFDPFWERAQALGVPVYLHAADAPQLPASLAGRPELVGATWSWTAETATHALRIVFGGVLERFPRTRLVLGHLGETLPFFLWRLDQRARAFTDLLGGQLLPSQQITRNIHITTSGSFSDDPLSCVISAMGEDNVLYSVDYPFESMTEAATWFHTAPLSDTARAKVAQQNARHLLRL
jgi:2,3-dihydroxybenzoate decarboxylase